MHKLFSVHAEQRVVDIEFIVRRRLTSESEWMGLSL